LIWSLWEFELEVESDVKIEGGLVGMGVDGGDGGDSEYEGDEGNLSWASSR